ncbi:hypothetical protein M6D93_16020 [Jatrophihabitans telluris]|uniref:Glyoxalase-like domain-containing protein n=1 Tax=Jatrophihabitans telluris TaxID=2038343 RepID=A0ABY4QWS3_9ACTN|nr:VOC family protein [Jatrophihabitans telluris]UQX87794.1 hypothetical protein M6D93_16020 [Jatrophihabitans telluris]
MATPQGPLARYQALCIDTVDPIAASRFWAPALGLTATIATDGDVRLEGPTPTHLVWLNKVPEPKSVKNRLHVDVFTGSLTELEALGARQLQTFARWTIMADPEGQEFCAFVRPAPVTGPRLKDLAVDSNDPERIARWWQQVLGGTLDRDPEEPWWWLDGIEGAPFESIDFGEVPEHKSAKNRLHIDIELARPDDLLDLGATLIRRPDDDISWTVMADPDGNEFCAFEVPPPA